MLPRCSRYPELPLGGKPPQKAILLLEEPRIHQRGPALL